MNYYISDTHFDHESMIKLCNRPFETVEEMNEAMISNWNSVVKDDDDVYFLGDFGWMSDNLIKILRSLSGKKHLVVGNHDIKCLKSHRFRKEFVEIHNVIIVKDNGRRIVLSHYPMAEWDGFQTGSWHFYGHIHNNEGLAAKFMDTLPRAMNVGADVLDFTPRTAEWLMNLKSCM